MKVVQRLSGGRGLSYRWMSGESDRKQETGNIGREARKLLAYLMFWLSTLVVVLAIIGFQG
ncbi:hypothetical protein BELL_0006g00180 [Botrytis elliptica]|uniref:Uncharacterized protein n=1 Tax=Botrytis elliptica TaxID=278938 RepID=A0A4Z1K3M1_9HELO|nr:hypothetical protein BELL_0006g00180 [Botrytis elliptica]